MNGSAPRSVDLTFVSHLNGRDASFPAVFYEFTRWWNGFAASLASTLTGCAVGQAAPPINLWSDRQTFVDRFEEFNRGLDVLVKVWAIESARRLYDLDLDRSATAGAVNKLTVEVNHPHPIHGTQLDFHIRLIDAVVLWQRPAHLRFGPARYRYDHHPLDRARLGIVWIEWVPFALTPSDVPEAEIVRPMHGGALIASQRAFWQSHRNQQDCSKVAIERAREIELRLNQLGVLPTFKELRRGDWGR